MSPLKNVNKQNTLQTYKMSICAILPKFSPISPKFVRCLHLAPPFLVEDYQPIAQMTIHNRLLEQKTDLAIQALK